MDFKSFSLVMQMMRGDFIMFDHVPAIDLTKDGIFVGFEKEESTSDFELREVAESKAYTFRRFGDSACWTPRTRTTSRTGSMDRHLHVRALSIDMQYEDMAIILGSGSDAMLLPESFNDVGALVKGNTAALWDTEGGKISTGECRGVSLEFETDDGNVVLLRDRGHVSPSVGQPLTSYGRMLKKGWQILMGEFNQPKLFHATQNVSIPISYKNRSLVVAGRLQRISHVCTVKMSMPSKWSKAPISWRVTSQGFPLVSSGANNYVGPPERFAQGECATGLPMGLRKQNATRSSLPRTWTSSATRRQQWMGSSTD